MDCGGADFPLRMGAISAFQSDLVTNIPASSDGFKGNGIDAIRSLFPTGACAIESEADVGALSRRDQARGAESHFLPARTEGKPIAVPCQKALLQVEVVLIGALRSAAAPGSVIGLELYEYLGVLADA